MENENSKPSFISNLKGAFYLFLSIVIWVAATVLIKMIYQNPENSYEKPLFLTYYSSCFFCLYWIPLITNWLSLKLKKANELKQISDTHLDESRSLLLVK